LALYQKGQTGNPGGRPKAALPIRTLCRRVTVELYEKALTMIRDPDTPQSVKATLIINMWDRAWGKPTQTVTMRQEEVAQLTDADLAAIAGGRDFEGIENGADQNGIPVFDVDTEDGQLVMFDASKPA
jgi:hypothetical protein